MENVGFYFYRIYSDLARPYVWLQFFLANWARGRVVDVEIETDFQNCFIYSTVVKGTVLRNTWEGDAQ